ncbi:MAG: plasmid mobilization relaxosome protein MobC [Clostridia bacterium]|nr:plasmid mobilization relaxosome protein MobC [Clostridia bacterium]
MVVQLRMIGNNLNQLTALFHKHGFPNVPELKKISQDVHRMNQLFIDSFSQE